ncbi:MAG: 4-hydroxy-tetrahydrodipicolinate synthase [Candidatus Polarisedimenticolia bacterium]
MNAPRLRGVFTALVTPFAADGGVDMAAFERLLDRQLAAGVAGLVPCGTTGETPALDEREWEALIAATARAARGKAFVIPGTGTNNTKQSIARTRRAKELGADAALVVTPYYNKPNPDGLLAHYKAIAAEGGLPLVLYNVPGRTGLNAAPELVLRIAEEVPGLEAIKEASGNLGQAMTLIDARRPDFAVISGEDELTCAMALMGGDGVISVVSNVDPAGTVKMVAAAIDGDVETARREHYRLLPLTRALFAETNPVPSKAAMARLGLLEDVVRPPLAPAGAATRAKLEAGLKAAGLI